MAKSVQAKGEKPIVLEIIGKGGEIAHRHVDAGAEKGRGSFPVSGLWSFQPNGTVRSRFVRPGIVLDYTTYPNISYPQLQGGHAGQAPVILNTSSKSQDAGPALTKRLDSLDSELKELRKLVEELQATAAKIVEREKGEQDRDQRKRPAEVSSSLPSRPGWPPTSRFGSRHWLGAIDNGQPGFFEPALDHRPVPAEAVLVHRVRAKDRRAIVSPHDLRTARRGTEPGERR